MTTLIKELTLTLLSYPVNRPDSKYLSI